MFKYNNNNSAIKMLSSIMHSKLMLDLVYVPLKPCIIALHLSSVVGQSIKLDDQTFKHFRVALLGNQWNKWQCSFCKGKNMWRTCQELG